MLMHQEEKLKLGEKKKILEDEIAQFIEKKTMAESILSQVSVSTPVVSLKTHGLQKVSADASSQRQQWKNSSLLEVKFQ